MIGGIARKRSNAKEEKNLRTSFNSQTRFESCDRELKRHV
jgi:hypothetical protein